jgi:ornithine cyclodeaminase/alanine dehydrogenase-like protein (mu-crystallin family)
VGAAIEDLAAAIQIYESHVSRDTTE